LAYIYRLRKPICGTSSSASANNRVDELLPETINRYGEYFVSQPEHRSIRSLLWAIFAWLGVPAQYAVVLLFGHFGGPFVKQGVLVLITAAFVACGTTAIVKGQRPRLAWVVLLYPLPMFLILGVVATAIALLAGGRGV
jgi:hypothetical protein